MADAKITALAENITPAIDDVIPIVDMSDTPDTTEKITLASIFGLIYPVGSLYISTLSTNPATLLGVGTWAVFGAGKTLVSLDSGDTDFDTVEETRGAKTHTLITAEMPAHDHSLKGSTAAGSAAEGIAFGNDTTPDFTNAAPVNNTGGGGAHNNIQPSIVVYMWKRTA